MKDFSGRAVDDVRKFRNALATFATGVTVVTTRDGEGATQGFTANSFTSVSLNPPLILVCVARSANCFPIFAACKHFAVNILHEEQRAVSEVFAVGTGDRFSGIDWEWSPLRSPRLRGVVSWLDCRTVQSIDAGDHIILVGEVEHFDYSQEAPLGYCGGNYISFDLAGKALLSTSTGDAVEVGAIIEYDNCLFLQKGPAGILKLPCADRLGVQGDDAGLYGLLASAGVTATLSFVYSVYEDETRHSQCIYYRGVASDLSCSAKEQLLPIDAIPWSEFDDPAVVSMLQRYVREKKNDAFGIYIGDEKQGRVEQLATQVVE